MRIGIDAKRAFYNSRGLGNYSRDLIRILTELHPEHAYLLFCAKKAKKPLMDCPLQSQIVEPTSFFYKQFPTLWRSVGIPSEYSRQRLDIYHGLSNEIPYQFGKSATRTVLTMHDLIFLKFPELYPWVDQKVYLEKYLSSCKRADSIIAISQQTKQDLMELADIDENKINVIHQGCNPIFRSATSLEKQAEVCKKYNLPQTFILNVGAIEERKNQMLIVEALFKSKLDVPLVIVGRPVGNWQQELEQQISRMGLTSRVIFLNDVPTIDLPALYQLSSLFVYPSFYEGFGIPLLEALTSGIPVISSKGSCLEEAGGPGSIYIDPRDAIELGDSIDQILSNSPKREQMVQDGYLWAEQFSDKNIADKVMNVYSSLI